MGQADAEFAAAKQKKTLAAMVSSQFRVRTSIPLRQLPHAGGK
jgi:hypothetical protein